MRASIFDNLFNNHSVDIMFCGENGLFLAFFLVFILFFLVLTLFLNTQQVAKIEEVFLHDETHTLGVQTVACEVAVVGLIVDVNREVAVREDEVTQVEVADEALCGVGVVAITKLSVEEQTVVEQSSAQDALVLCIVESFVACRDVGSEVPVAAVDEARQHVVDLLRDGSAQQTLHRQ